MIVTDGGNKSSVRAQPRQIFSNISGNAAGRNLHVAWIRVKASKGLLRPAVNVDIGTANGGLNFYIGNNPNARGPFLLRFMMWPATAERVIPSRAAIVCCGIMGSSRMSVRICCSRFAITNICYSNKHMLARLV